MLEENQLKTLIELLVAIGTGSLMSILIAKRLLHSDSADLNEFTKKTKAAIIGTEGMLVSYSKCCRPVPGDDIVAQVSHGKGLTVHRHECKKHPRLGK